MHCSTGLAVPRVDAPTREAALVFPGLVLYRSTARSRGTLNVWHRYHPRIFLGFISVPKSCPQQLSTSLGTGKDSKQGVPSPVPVDAMASNGAANSFPRLGSNQLKPPPQDPDPLPGSRYNVKKSARMTPITIAGFEEHCRRPVATDDADRTRDLAHDVRERSFSRTVHWM